MSLRARASCRALTAVLSVAVALLGSGCHRAVKPDVGQDRTLEAGVPVDFGSQAPEAPEVTWDFGDGTASVRGARPSHAYAREGTYTVRALEKEEVLGSVRVTVVPRPVLRAIPADVEMALYFPQLRGNVEPLMDFVSRLMGEEQARQAMESLPLLSNVVREVRGEPRILDVEEGAALFAVEGFDGVVGLMGVTDERAAMDAVVEDLTSSGLTLTRREPGGVLLGRTSGTPLLLFADRGYLYLVMPEEPEASAPVKAEGTGGSAPPGPATAEALEALRARVTGMGDAVLSKQPLFDTLHTKVGPGNVHLFARPASKDVSETLQGLWATLKLDGGQADLEGWVATDVWPVGSGVAPPLALLARAPAGPIAALTLSIPPEDLTRLAYGAPGSERREKTLLRLREEGLDAAGAEALVSSLKGDLSLLAYFDAVAFYRNFLQGNRKPEPRGSLLFHAGLLRSAPLLEWITGRLKEYEQPYEVSTAAGGTTLRMKVWGQPVEVSITADAVTLRGGESLQGRTQGDLGVALRKRFGEQAFVPGHLSLGVDVGQMLADLDVAEVPGVDPRQMPMAKALVETVVDQSPPIETLFVDLSPEQGGGRFRLRTVLRAPSRDAP